MGELHLFIYCERMKREYDIDLHVGNPTKSNQEVLVNMPKLLDISSQDHKENKQKRRIFHVNSLIQLKDKIFQMNIFLPLKKHSTNAQRKVLKPVIQL
jgi:translation elongation factor EF-G